MFQYDSYGRMGTTNEIAIPITRAQYATLQLLNTYLHNCVYSDDLCKENSFWENVDRISSTLSATMEDVHDHEADVTDDIWKTICKIEKERLKKQVEKYGYEAVFGKDGKPCLSIDAEPKG